jgi:signal transduction histidine kinase
MKFHLPIMAGLSLAVIVFEVYDHTIDQHLFLTDFEFWVEVLVYGLLLPVLLVLLLRTLESSLREREKTAKILNQQFEFKQKLTYPQSWDQLVETIVRFPADILPALQTFLHIYDQEKAVFVYSGGWRQAGIVSHAPPLVIKDHEFIRSSPVELHLQPCQSAEIELVPDRVRSYCLPLQVDQDTRALLHVELPAGFAAADNQGSYLSAVAPEIAQALFHPRFSRHNPDQEDTLKKYRLQVAKDLHDTLGQDIAYLRLKLDQLLQVGNLEKITEIRLELERMHTAADRAFGHMRTALDSLKPASCQEIVSQLQSHAQMVSKRAEFSLRFNASCDSLMLPPEMSRELLLIFGEAIHNVEKHTRARHLSVDLYQDADDFCIDIQDDGRGFDFAASQTSTSQNGHYGMDIMRERTASLGGQFFIRSSPGAGTTVSLKLPFPTGQLRAEQLCL